MKQFRICLFLLLLIHNRTIAQDTTLEKDIYTYLTINGTEDQYSNAYESLLKMLVVKYPKSDANTLGWDI